MAANRYIPATAAEGICAGARIGANGNTTILVSLEKKTRVSVIVVSGK